MMDCTFKVIKDAAVSAGVASTERSTKVVRLYWEKGPAVTAKAVVTVKSDSLRTTTVATVESDFLTIRHKVILRWRDLEPLDRTETVTVCTLSQLSAVLRALEETHE